jgi:hypothetical protein
MRFNHPRLVWRMCCEAAVSWKANTVAALLLRGEAGVVRLRHDRGQARRKPRDGDHADGHAHLEILLVPLEVPRLHRVADLRCRRLGEVGAAVLEEHRELVAADAREHLAVAQARLHHGCDAAQQLVAGEMAERIVDAVEEVEVDVEQRVRAALRLCSGDRALEALLERLAVRQPRERVVVGEERSLAYRVRRRAGARAGPGSRRGSSPPA